MNTEQKTHFDELCEQVEIIFPRPLEKMTVPARAGFTYRVMEYPKNLIGDVQTPREDIDEWHKQAVGMRLSVRYKGREYAFDYWMGIAHLDVANGRPNRENTVTLRLKPDAITPGSLMFSLLIDHYSADDDFEEFCAEYGYDTDSRRAERIYRAVQEQARQMRRLLGDDLHAFLEALQEQERY
ncbi:MAG: hypothetical protein LUG50_06895 [Planctomycetaceae bacterium]|nr:hypothetical protein [Planctomycetaceae bacterium]